MNSKKNTSQKGETTRAHTTHDWMTPVNDSEPCGPDLEYDPEFIVLAGKMVTRVEAQYGDFVGTPEPVNWSDIDRDCRRLMMRSKDIRLAVLFTRCRTRLANAAGLAEGIGLLAAWLETFPASIHPQPGVDTDHDAALEIRMNALQSLTDTAGLLADVREIALTKSTATRLQVRDVERAFAHPRPGDALAPESVTRQLDDLRAQQPATLAGFDEALAGVAVIDAWSREHLGLYAPDLSALTRMLRHLAGGERRSDKALPEVVVADAQFIDEDEGTAPNEPLSAAEESAAPQVPAAIDRRANTTSTDRHAALELIREARQWFEQHEPSSPIPVLLRRAEQFVGKRYAEVVHAIPAELLTQWSSDET
jgi:type VI secretion system protein ImpA